MINLWAWKTIFFVIKQISFCLLVLKTFRLIAVLPLAALGTLQCSFFLSGVIDGWLQELIQKIVRLFVVVFVSQPVSYWELIKFVCFDSEKSFLLNGRDQNPVAAIMS